MATAMKTAKGFKVICPFCFDADGDITIELSNLAACKCGSCCEEFSPVEALSKLNQMGARWAAIVAWVKDAPVTD